VLGSGILTGQQTAFEQQSRALLKVRAPLCMRVMVADMHVRWVHCIDMLLSPQSRQRMRQSDVLCKRVMLCWESDESSLHSASGWVCC
jgi:hypothetical protein